MELIKKIKQAEAQAQEIIEQAKAQAATQAEEARQHRRQLLEKAEQQRKKATEAAVAEAQSQGHTEVKNLKTQVKNLKTQAEKQRQQLRDKAGSKMATAAARITDYLGSHSTKTSQNGAPSRG
jgi:vacuolar-type H+-ATPase subunit H